MPALPTITKTNQSVLAWTDVATANVSRNEISSLTGTHRIAIQIQMGRRSGSAFTSTALPSVSVDATTADSGDDRWTEIDEIVFSAGSSIANTTLSANVSAGATTFTVTSATNIAAGDLLYLHNATAGNIELVRVLSVSGSTITPEDPVKNAHSSGDAVTDQAERYFPVYDIQGYKRLRVTVHNANSGQTLAARIDATVLS